MARLNFNALRDLHISANDLLHSPVTQKALAHHKQKKWVHEVSEASLRKLELCGISKDVLLLVKEHLQDLQFTLRRMVIGESDISAKIAAYNRYRMKLKKQKFKCLQSLRGMTNKAITASDVYSVDSMLVVVVDVLKEVRVMVISRVESLLSLISMPWLDRKSAKGSFTAKWSKFI